MTTLVQRRTRQSRADKEDDTYSIPCDGTQQAQTVLWPALPRDSSAMVRH